MSAPTSRREPDSSVAPRIRPFPQAVHLPLDLIDPNPDQPRRTLDGIPELAAHIKLHGLLQPIVVTLAPNDRYTLVAGHRRFAALQWLARNDTYPDRWYDIPAIVRTIELADRLPLALAENLARHNLSDAEVAASIQLLADVRGWSQGQIARSLGVSRQRVNQYARVSAEPDLAAHVGDGALSVATAYEVLRAHTAEARRAALAAALEGAPFSTVRRLAEGAAPSADDATNGPIPQSPSTPDDGQVRANDAQLVKNDEQIETGTTRYRGARDWHPPAGPAGPPSFADALGAPVRLESLALYALFQEAERHKLPAIPSGAIRRAILKDMPTLPPGRPT